MRVILAQIGAAWLFSDTLEEAYASYERNARTLRRFQESGLTVLDTQPERLVEAILEELTRHIVNRHAAMVAQP